MGGGAAGGRELDTTPTWAVALVCLVIVVISIILEKTIHKTSEVIFGNVVLDDSRFLYYNLSVLIMIESFFLFVMIVMTILLGLIA